MWFIAMTHFAQEQLIIQNDTRVSELFSKKKN